MTKLSNLTKNTDMYLEEMINTNRGLNLHIEIEFYNPTLFEFAYRLNFETVADNDELFMQNYKRKAIVRNIYPRTKTMIIENIPNPNSPNRYRNIEEISYEDPHTFQIFSRKK